ncbi:alpha/beta hydrolase family protein [Kribbella sp. NPDC000426]|uniref:alpha/beta fold hydrolase n=1 Tax=Kribbella sp. NPDC000426 TaxID=3154255 RepID=UPI0033180214
MTTFVLVPGGWKGSWAYEAVVPFLEGHEVHALTLTGLAPDDDETAVATANLDTHADDVLRLLERADLTDVTLVGHSYAGMVITAAADRAAGRISRMVHLDAFVPRDSESWWSLVNDYFRNLTIEGSTTSGYAVRPPGNGDPRRRPHPLASFMQEIRLTGKVDEIRRRDFVYCEGWADQTPFAGLHTRLRADPAWQVHEVPTGHNVMNEAPQFVADLLLS